ncbi:MAG TPA: type II toxin-antitoxin system prevent-host-death family antitoxin [Phycisphaerales bacterium]|nr:type II toxin-antitoxin system prevent-host-death family antitoxin [Phycisphaerales bacterium]
MRIERMIPLSDAKTNLSEIVESVSRGSEVTITRRGKPVARIVALRGSSDSSQRAGAISRMIERRSARSLKGLSIRAMIREGRK